MDQNHAGHFQRKHGGDDDDQSEHAVPQRRRNFAMTGKSKGAVFLLLLFTLGLAEIEFANSGPPAREIIVDLDERASEIEFTLGATLHTVRGTFEVKDASVLRVDMASGELSGRISVDVRSGRTGNGERDRQMHQEVLESAQFPEAIFSPRHLEGRLALTGESMVSVRGVLRIHGQVHDVALPAKVSVENGHFTATSRLSVPYVRWGMKDPSNVILRVSKTVELEMRVAGAIRQQP